MLNLIGICFRSCPSSWLYPNRHDRWLCSWPWLYRWILTAQLSPPTLLPNMKMYNQKKIISCDVAKTHAAKDEKYWEVDYQKSRRRMMNYILKDKCVHHCNTVKLDSDSSLECGRCGFRNIYKVYKAQLELNRYRAEREFDEYLDHGCGGQQYPRFPSTENNPLMYPFKWDWATKAQYNNTCITLVSKKRMKVMCELFDGGSDSFKEFCCAQNADLLIKMELWCLKGILYTKLCQLRPENVVHQLRRRLFKLINEQMFPLSCPEQEAFVEGLENVLRKYGNSTLCAETACPFARKRFGKYCKAHALINMYKTNSGEVQFLGSEAVGTYLKEVLENAGPITHDVPILGEILATLVAGKDEVVRKLEQKKEGTNWLKIALAATACAITISRCYKDKIAVTSALAQFIISLDLVDQLKGQIIDFVLGFLRGRQGQVQIESSGIETLIMLAGPFVVTILSALVIKQIPKGSDWSGFLANYSRIGATISSTEALFSKAQQLTAFVVKYVKEKVFNIIEEDEWSSINKWCDDVQLIMNTDLEVNIRGNMKLKSTIDTLIIRGNKILKLLDDLKIPVTQRSRVQQCMLYLHKARTMAATGGAGHTEPRVAPIIVHLVGASGTGKSSILYPLMSKLLVSMGSRDPDDLRTKCYFKHPSKDGRWDGYPNECEICVCDDIFTQKDTAANPSQEALETIRMSNTAFYQLAMAELKDKGTTFFKAKTVIWTSNRHSFNFESLTNKEALIRRITVRYRQKPHPDYALLTKQGGKDVEILDQEKVGVALRKDKKNLTKVVLFDKEDTQLDGDPVVLRANMTFEEMANEVISINTANIERFDDYNAGIEDFMKEEIKLAQQKDDQFAREQGYADAEKGLGDYFRELFDEAQKQDNHEGEAQVDNEPSYLDDPKEIFFFEDSWFNRIITGKRHINVKDSVLSYCNESFYRSGIDEQAPPTMHDYMYMYKGEMTHLSAIPCVVIDAKIAERFIYASAKASVATFMIEDGSAQEKWNNIFFKYFAGNFRPETCEKHEESQHSRENFFTHIRRHFARWAAEQDWGKRIQCMFEEIYEQNCYLAWILRGVSLLLILLYIFMLYRAVKKIVNAITTTTKAVYNSLASAGSFMKGLFVTPEVDEPLPKEIEEHLQHIGNVPSIHRLRKAIKLLPSEALPTRGENESKATDKTLGRKTTNVESKDIDKTKGRKLTNVESKSIDIGKGRKMTNVEVWNYFFSNEQESSQIICDWLKEYLTERIGSEEVSDLEKGIIPAKFSATFGEMIDELAGSIGKCKAREIILGLIEIDGEAQSVTDQNASELGPIVLRNMYKLQYFDGQVWKRALNILFLKGRMAIVNKHVNLKKNETQWRIVNQSGNEYLFNLWNCNTATFTEQDGDDYFKDLMMVEFPRYVHQHVDITSKFMTSDDFSRFSSLAQACLFSYDGQTENVKYMFTNTIDAFDQDFGLRNNSICIGKIRKYFLYGIQTAAGDCGGLICAYDQSFARKLIGIHAAGMIDSKYQGVGQPVTQQTLNKLFSRMKTVAPDSMMFPNIEEHLKGELKVSVKNGMLECSMESNFVHFGEANTSIHHPRDSNIHPSPLHGKICEPTMKQAYLRPLTVGELIVNPMTLARAKASFVPTEPIPNLVATCTRHYSQIVDTNVSAGHRRVLSLEEAIAGVEGDEFLDGINRRTSPGFGLKGSGPGKTQWLGTDDYIVDNPYVVAECNKLLEACKQGIRPSVIWVDCLKDERRPIEKANAGKTRLFSVGEMIYTIVFRRYFLGFTAHMMRNRIDVEACIGTNVYNRDWTRIADKITSLGPHVIAGDFANYDGSMNSTMLWSVLDVIEQFYQGTPEDKIVRAALWSEVVNSIHIYENRIYGWTHSNPSGCPITAILNSVYHSISARYVYLICAKKYSPENCDLGKFQQFVRHVNYGDDDVWNIHPEIVEWFNQLTITDAYATIGMTYTDEAKTGVLVQTRTLDQIQFLKRTFRWDENQSRYRAPLSLTTIREMPMWVRGRVDVRQLTEDTLAEAVHELAQHEESVFDTEIVAFDKGRKALGPRCNVVFNTYDHYQEIEYNKWCEVDFYNQSIPTIVEISDNRSETIEEFIDHL